MAKAWLPCEKSKVLIREYFELSGDSPSGLVWQVDRGDNKLIGKPALCTLQSNKRYFRGNLKSLVGGQRQLLAHRVVFFLYNGCWPVGVIDHIDGNTLNNDPLNLRDVSFSENGINQDSRGYRYRKDTILPWEVQVQFEGFRYSPRFATEEEAAQAARDIKSKVAVGLGGKFRWSDNEVNN
ncbi:HNH endonuclease [Pectobacterium phage DU_PP_IV]|nr:HNH endonuclease [Pectobacterium phage DU_PP_IV]